MKQVKGTMLKLVIKKIKADKSEAYDNILSDEVKDWMNQRILDSIWYPFEVYKECLNALFKISAKGKPELFMQWSRLESEKSMKNIYKQAISEGNLENALEKYERFYKMIFNFGEIQSKIISDNQIIVDYIGFEKDFENFFYIAIGWLEKFIELCIGKKSKYEFIKKTWEGDDITQFMLTLTS